MIIDTYDKVMILYQRVEALERRVARLEEGETTAYCQNCGDAPHKPIKPAKRCRICGREHEEMSE